ncbi:MAG: polyribonucleotide nucleotidyltransferase [Thermotogae bacterium]|nr:polyribonucleotide nucleotidyltransferase [Thermotogota bacterium]
MQRRYELNFEGRKLTIEPADRWAKQAAGSALVRMGDTVVLAAATYKKADPKNKRDFLPLLVEYREESFAAGKIPGGFFRREGKPREKEIVYGRAIDRSLRPLFPKGMTDDVELAVMLISYDMEYEGNFLGAIASSLALTLSEIPFNGPIGAVRLTRKDGKFILFPTNVEVEEGEFDLLVAGTPGGKFHMIELGGKEVPEEVLIEALRVAQEPIELIVDVQEDLQERLGKEKFQPTLLKYPEGLKEEVESLVEGRLLEALLSGTKGERNEALERLKEEVIEKLSEKYPDSEVEIGDILYKLERDLLRKYVLENDRRIDGRALNEIRPLSAEVGVLPRVHGSAIFSRGETLALVSTTLGTHEDMQMMTELDVEEFKRFMLHYNFPPFSVGEVRPMRGPGRREIGHGNLAEKALEPLIPDEETFPYTVRVVSDILSSNGSTSMASVCGGSLALMDAGVPIREHVAGISIGLITSPDRSTYKLLTDIQGMEDFFGDMDFKVAGTRKGITAIQLDLKIDGLTLDMIEAALNRAKEARYHILDFMNGVISKPREKVSEYAPKVITLRIDPSKVGDVIGPGGRVIKSIISQTDTKINIDDETGNVFIYGSSYEGVEKAKNLIEEITADLEVGKTYIGEVYRIEPYGIFVRIGKKEALLHISEYDFKRTTPEELKRSVKIGDRLLVKVIDIDEFGRIKVSRKQAMKGVSRLDTKKPRKGR